MLEWFATLGLPLFIFYGIAIVASLILIVQVGLMIFGLGDDLDADMDDVGDPGGLHILSLRSLTGFFGGFGWTGAILLGKGSSLVIAIVAGAGVGGVLMLSVAYLMSLLYSLRESGNIDYKDAIGQIGTVYLTIPPDQSGPGKIRVMIDGRLKVVLAYTKSNEQMSSERKVRVVAQLDARTLMVEPLGGESLPENEREA